MAMDIIGFRSSLQGGGARPSNFELFFPTLPNIPSAVTSTLAQAAVRAQAASIPPARVSSIDVYYQGRPIKVVGERTFTPWTVRFYNDTDFKLRDFFEAWNNMENTLAGNQVEFTDNILAINQGYKVDGVLVRQLNKQLQDVRSYEFFGMYPEVVGEIELNWEASNRIETFDVQFAYDFWIPAISDTDQLVPGTYDVEGVGANSALSSAASGNAPASSQGVTSVLPVSSGVSG